MKGIAKKVGSIGVLLAAFAPAIASATVNSCEPQLVETFEGQVCLGDDATWVASASTFTVTISVVDMDTSELSSISTQGFDEDQQEIGGCIAFRQQPGSDTSDRCNRTVFFHETTENG